MIPAFARYRRKIYILPGRRGGRASYSFPAFPAFHSDACFLSLPPVPRPPPSHAQTLFFFLSFFSSSRASTLTRSSCTRVTLVSLVCVSKSANSAAFHHVPSLGGPVRACALSSPPIPDDCSAIPVSFFLRISFFSASGALERVARCLWGMFRESSRTKNDARNRAKRGKHEDGKRWRPRF